MEEFFSKHGRNSLELVKNAELFAKEKHSGIIRNDGKTPYSKHQKFFVLDGFMIL
jgi:hypothetical protein